jgi:hypothetical protein
MSLVRIAPTTDERGAPIFAVLTKRTYRFGSDQPVKLLETETAFVEGDEYWDGGDPTWSTVKLENDLAPYKLATDVVVVGRAHSPNGRPVTQMEATVGVGRFKKKLLVLGDRRCIYRPAKPPEFSDPVPFTEMEVRYDRAYGGKDEKSLPGIEFYYPRNTMGTGIAIKNLKEVVDGLPLPNFEDPDDLLTPERMILEEPDRWNKQPLPQGFGWFQKVWYPRCSFVGSIPGYVDVDEVMREELLNWVPKRQIALSRQFRLPSFDVRFNNGASWGLIVPFLSGNEHVSLHGLTPSGQCEFDLPGEKPRIVLDFGLGESELIPYLHTVCIRMDEQEVDLVWRGAKEYPGVDWLPQMKGMHAEASWT